MFHRLKQLFLCGLLVVSVRQASGFSLLGPLDTWQTTALGFGLAGDVGGPMALGNEYRWNSKVIVYAFSPAFLNFFGTKGVAAVEKSIKVLNDLPPASAMSSNLAEYPLDTRGVNFTAQALNLQDIGSWSLSLILESLGLANPERYVHNIRFMDAAVPPTQFTTIRLNYDPVTLQQSSYVNGTLFTYRLIQTGAAQWEAVDIPVDPEAPTVTSVVGLAGSLTVGSVQDGKGLSVVTNAGFYYDGLTRDDVGALKYLLNPQNVNTENLPADATTGATASNTGTTSSTTSAGSPWKPVAVPGAAAGGAAGGGAAATVTLVATAQRQGVNKIKFVRGGYDSAFAFTNLQEYQENLFVNGVAQSQTVQRLLTAPDILFDVGPLGVNANGLPIMVDGRTTTVTFDASGATGAPGAVQAGPGTISGPIVLTFNNLGPGLFNNSPGDEGGAIPLPLWSTFDGSTNAPIVFPDLLGILEQEKRVIKTGSQWRVPDAANSGGAAAAPAGGQAAGAGAPIAGGGAN